MNVFLDQYDIREDADVDDDRNAAGEQNHAPMEEATAQDARK